MTKQDKHVRFAFNFDLDTTVLKEQYPSDSSHGYKQAWADIRSFMEANDFTHTQYSGYESIDELSYFDAYVVLETLQETFPWFLQCAQVATLTEIGERYDVLDHLARQVADKEQTPHWTGMALKDKVKESRLASQELNANDSDEIQPEHDR